MNRRYTKVTVYTTSPSKIILGELETETAPIRRRKNYKVELNVKRQNKPLQLIVVTDSVKKKVNVKPVLSIAYLLNIYDYGIGYLAELGQPKRFGYPGSIHINTLDKADTNYTYLDPSVDRSRDALQLLFGSRGIPPDQKGKFFLHFSLPYINDLKLRPDHEGLKDRMSFFGFTMALDYFHSPRQYLSLSGSAISSFAIPVPAPLDYGSDYELISSNYLSLSNNHLIDRLSVGYGVSYSANKWEYVTHGYEDTTTIIKRERATRTNRALGLFFSSYYNIIKGLNIGVVYRPSFIRLNTTEGSKYEHLISFDIAYKVPLSKDIRKLKRHIRH